MTPRQHKHTTTRFPGTINSRHIMEGVSTQVTCSLPAAAAAAAAAAGLAIATIAAAAAAPAAAAAAAAVSVMSDTTALLSSP
jgi:hypothetical protein